jgi:hypothetical protein
MDWLQRPRFPHLITDVFCLCFIMINRSIDYILIRTTIFGFRLIAPASHLYLAASFHRQKFLISPWLGLYALAEAAFYLFIYLPRNHQLQKVTLIIYLTPIIVLTGQL